MRSPLLLGILAGVLVAFVAGTWGTDTALADAGPHKSNATTATADGCASCHRAHTAKGPSLIKAASTTELCYTCHGGLASSVNVQNGFEIEDTGNVPLRGGGFDFAMIDGASPTGQGAHASPLGGATIPVLLTGVAATSQHSLAADRKVWATAVQDPLSRAHLWAAHRATTRTVAQVPQPPSTAPAQRRSAS